MRRRQLLTGTALALAGLAGCSGGSGSDNATESPTSAGGTATPTESGGGDLATPAATVQTFYDTLYGNDDIEGANELYHPDYEGPPLSEANFEPYGGASAISADLQSTETISETETTTEIHATVDYSTPAGSATQVDWFELARDGEEWLLTLFYPESARNAATGTPTDSA